MADEWVDVKEDWVDVKEPPNKEWADVSTNTPDINDKEWQDVKPKSVKDFILQPISKQITGKSLTERMGLVEKQQKQAEKFGTERALQGKPPSALEFFMRGLPAQTGEVATRLVDVSPLDIGIMLGTAGAGKIPYKGVPIGEIASKIPVTKRFFKDIGEFTRYQNTLRATTPLSSRGITKAATTTPQPIIPPSQDLTGKQGVAQPTEGKVEGLRSALEINKLKDYEIEGFEKRGVDVNKKQFVEKTATPKEIMEKLTPKEQEIVWGKIGRIATEETKSIPIIVKINGENLVADGAHALAKAIRNGMGKPIKYYEQALSTPTGGKVIPDFAENINLTKYPEDVRHAVNSLITEKPIIGKTPAISDNELVARASKLKDTPTIKYLAQLPEGTVEAEALKVRQGNTEAIRQALGGELGNLKNQLDDIIEQGIGLHRKTASIFGRGLRQQRLPAETQQNMAFAIEESLKRIQKDPIFSKDQELIATVKKLKGIVVEKDFDPTVWNKVYYVWLNSILSNPFTHLVNTGSNALFTAAKIPEKFASAIWDYPLSLKTGKRTQFFGEIPAMVKGAFSKEPLPQEVMMGSKIDVLSQPIRGMAGKIVGFPTKALQLEDNLAKNLIGKMEYAGQKYAGKTGEELTSAVNAEQLYRTFQNDAGVVADALMTVRSKIPGLRYVQPFIKTPANLIARGLERTPLGAIKIARGLSTKTYSQEALSKDLGNLTLGTIGAGWIGYQWAKGNITGRAPSDAAERDAFYRQGKKPNAIKINGKWIPLGRLEPLGTSFSVISNLIQDYAKSPSNAPPEKIVDAFVNLGSTLVDKSSLSGFTGMIKAFADPEMYGGSFLKRIATGVEPQFLKFFADLKDPYYREANGILDEFKKKIPFLSETLPPKLNVFGEPVKKDFLNIGTEKNIRFEKMLEETPIGFPSKNLGKEKLTPEEYWWLLDHSGKQLKSILERFDYDKFNELPVGVREKIINQIVNKTREYPKTLLRINRLK